MKVSSQPTVRENRPSQMRAAEAPKSSEKTGCCHRRDKVDCGRSGESMRDTLRELFSGILKGMEDPGRSGRNFHRNSFDWLGDMMGGNQPSQSGGSSRAPQSAGTSPSSGGSQKTGNIDPYELAPHQKYGYDCGVTATRAALRAAGFDGDQDAILDDAIAKGYHTGRNDGAWTGPANMSKYLQSYGINSENEPFSQKNIESQLESGNPVIVSTDRHYFVISGKDENGNYIVGDTGTVVNKGTTISYSDLAAFSGGHTLVTIDAQNPPDGTRSPASRL